MKRKAFEIVLLLLLVGLLGACTCDSNEQGHLSAPAGGDLRYASAPREPFDAALRVACGELGWGAAGEDALLRHPYVQAVRKRSAEVVWVSEVSAQLAFSVAGEDSEEIADLQIDTSAKPAHGEQHVALLDNLQAGTVYCYQLRDGDATLFRGAFQTAPADDASIRFSALGDLGKDSSDQRAVLEQLRTVRSEFIVVPGDLAYESGTLAQFERYFFSVYRDLLALVPVFPATGNHDYGSEDAATFREVFRLFDNTAEGHGERWYSFVWGPAHILVLDTQRSLATQAAWMREELAYSTQPWRIVVLHKPPYSSGAHGSNQEVQAHFVPVFAELGIALVLAGHEHNYERTKDIDGVVYVITGGGGRGTREVGSSSFTEFSARVAHFVHIEADTETLTLHAIDATGAEFDSMRLTK